jgi:hypothetical protein
MNGKTTYGQDERIATIGFAEWGGHCVHDSLLHCSSSVFKTIICAVNLALRKSINHYWAC